MDFVILVRLLSVALFYLVVPFIMREYSLALRYNNYITARGFTFIHV